MSQPSAFTCDVATEEAGGVCVLTLSGSLDLAGAERFTAAAEKLRQAGHTRFVLDFAGVDYISSFGIQGLIELQVGVRPDGRVCVCNTTPNVQKVFDLTQLERLIRICPDRPAALAAARG